MTDFTDHIKQPKTTKTAPSGPTSDIHFGAAIPKKDSEGWYTCTCRCKKRFRGQSESEAVGKWMAHAREKMS